MWRSGGIQEKERGLEQTGLTLDQFIIFPPVLYPQHSLFSFVKSFVMQEKERLYIAIRAFHPASNVYWVRVVLATLESWMTSVSGFKRNDPRETPNPGGETFYGTRRKNNTERLI